MSITYKFSVVKGMQAQREYYIAMLPLGTLSKIFRNERDYIAPEFRAQRCINEARIPEIRDYILNNRGNYVFSALSASIDGSMKFIPSELDDSIGILEVDMEAVFLINDGQHRKAAIEAALEEAPDLARETISIVFFEDAGLKRSQQMFADLNKHAVKSTMSLSTLYDSRDDLANAVKEVVSKVSFLSKYTDEVDLLREKIKVTIDRDGGIEQKYYNIGEFEVLSGPKGNARRNYAQDEVDESELKKLED